LNVTSFTVCNYNYLDRALALAESYFEATNERMKVVIVDEKVDLPELPADILFIQDLEIPNFTKLAFKYDIIELSTAVKPLLAKRFLKETERVLFFDPDTYVLSDLGPIFEELEGCDFLLTPHHVDPQPTSSEESDLAMMRFGSFNLGFFALNATPESNRFLDWWWERCRDFNFMESQFGLSTDQKWVTIAPCFFPGLRISRNRGLNIAPWNSFERRLSLVDGVLRVGDVPAVFYHFSNFNPDDLDYRNKRSSVEDNTPDLVLTDLSAKYLAHYQLFSGLKRQYAFDYDTRGNYISPTLRRAYACMMNTFSEDVSPFTSDEIYRFARRNGLFERKNKPYKLVGFRSLKGTPVSLRIFTALLFLLLQIVGPNRFFDFCRLMVNRTLLWKNNDMWRATK
jgi:hypothetical protein